MNKITPGTIITYLVLLFAAVLCGVAAFVTQDLAPRLICCASGVAFAALLGALIGIRIHFHFSYLYWIYFPVKIGVRGRVGEVWEPIQLQLAVEKVIEFWLEASWPLGQPKGSFERSKRIAEALSGLTIIFKPSPWTYLQRKVVGLADSEVVFVAYNEDPLRVPFGHELSHVILGKLIDNWGEETSHKVIERVGFREELIHE